jgi:Acetyltransferase (GNAT) family
MAYEYRSAKKVDLPGIVALRASIGGGNTYFERSERYYNWKYFDNPTAKGIVKIAVTAENEIVGMVAATFKPCIVKEQATLCTEWGDFFTSEQHRMKGIFKSLCTEVERDLKVSHSNFSYTRPNDNSYPIMVKKFDFIDFGEIQEYFYFVNGNKLLANRFSGFVLKLAGLFLNIGLRIYHKYPARNAESKKIKVLETEEFDRLKLNVKSKGIESVSLDKSKTFLRWRYLESPIPTKFFAIVEANEITSYLISAYDKKDKAYLVDFNVANEKMGNALMSEFIVDAKASKLKLISTFLKDEHKEIDLMVSMIHKYRFKKIGKNLHFTVQSADLSFNKHTWFFRLGDIDGI